MHCLFLSRVDPPHPLQWAPPPRRSSLSRTCPELGQSEDLCNVSLMPMFSSSASVISLQFLPRQSVRRRIGAGLRFAQPTSAFSEGSKDSGGAGPRPGEEDPAS